MDATELHATTDGAVWAREFCDVAKRNGADLDEAWVIGWFANAIECGRTHGGAAIPALREAADASFVALRNVEDWQWGKREPDLREDQLLSAETVRPLITDAIAKIKATRSPGAE